MSPFKVLGADFRFWNAGELVVSTGGVNTWTLKVCRIMAFWAIFKGFGPLLYLLWGFR